MTLSELRTLVDYHYWAGDRLLEAVARLTPEQFTRKIESSFPSVRETLVHLCGADWIWVSRWEGQSPTALPNVRELTDLEAIRTAWSEQQRRVRAVLDTLGEDGVMRPMQYRAMDGRSFEQPFYQMLQHVVNHGSYHRGQVTMMLRQLAATPPKPMDLAAFHREMGSGVV
jgi:uncharacterized damage-inducible protein DinB